VTALTVSLIAATALPVAAQTQAAVQAKKAQAKTALRTVQSQADARKNAIKRPVVEPSPDPTGALDGGDRFSKAGGMPPTAPQIVRPSIRQEGARPSQPSSDRISRPDDLTRTAGSDSGSDRIRRPPDPYTKTSGNTSAIEDYDRLGASNRAADTSTSKAGLRNLDSAAASYGTGSNSTGASKTGSGKSGSSNTASTGGSSPLPKTAPPPPTKSGAPATATSGSAPSANSTADMYPSIGKLEQLTFGASKPEVAIEDRLLTLESAVFAKTYANDSLFDRTERLKNTLLGKGALEAPGTPPPQDGLEPPSGWVENPMAGSNPDPAELIYLDEIVARPDSYHKASKAVLDSFALELINYERQRRALGNLEPNHLAQRMADEHVADLVERNVVSHSNSKGDNPDKRYTSLGGVDAVNENLAVLNSADLGTAKLCKAAVAKILKQMLMQQDDREALLAPEATHIGFAMHDLNEGANVLACIEVVTNRGAINPVPKTARVGDKIEVEGTVNRPYVFERITLAWEGTSDLPPQEEGGTEALPYFPPLDFVAYKEKSEKDHSKAIFALKTVGMLAAIAGGMFVPPVALAAPLIMMSGPDPGEAKPVSDVPIKGGVKVSGDSFSSKVTLSNDGKEGLYYLTVWANMGADDKPVAISRRTITVKQVHDEEDVSGAVSIPKDEKGDTNGDGKAKPTDSVKPADGTLVRSTDPGNDKPPDSGVAKTPTSKPAQASLNATPAELTLPPKQIDGPENEKSPDGKTSSSNDDDQSED
jgi:uncharacterized protein YkwD